MRTTNVRMLTHVSIFPKPKLAVNYRFQGLCKGRPDCHVKMRGHIGKKGVRVCERGMGKGWSQCNKLD